MKRTMHVSGDSFTSLWVLVLASLLLWGCGAGVKPVSHPGVETKPMPPQTPPDAGTGNHSRLMASRSLTAQGADLLGRKNVDGALRILEKAVGINPADGQGYYYLAEAWIQKKNLVQASRFNGLAAIYLRSDPVWARRAQAQKRQIDQLGKSH